MLPLLLATTTPADAGLGSLVRAAAKLGSSAGKAGGAAAKGAAGAAKVGGVAAKSGVALKGASVLGTTLAAERVFAHVADDAARIGVFVGPADDGLRIVMESGDELAHTTGSFQKFVDDLDGMAAVAPEAGVDLYVDADALRHLGELKVGPNTRLFLANTDGPSLPLRVASDGVAEVGGSGRTWFRVSDAVDLVQLGIDVADLALDEDVRLYVNDPDCGPVPGALAELSLAARGDRVVVLGPAPDVPDVLAVSLGIDVIVPGVLDPCPAGAPEAVEAVVARVRAATTVGELWSLASGDVVIDEIRRVGQVVLVRGGGLVAAHVVAAVEPEGSFEFADDDEPPAWFYGLVGVGLVGFGAWKIRRWTGR